MTMLSWQVAFAENNEAIRGRKKMALVRIL